MNVGTIMHEDIPYSGNMIVDQNPSLTSQNPLENRKITKLIGIELGPVSALTDAINVRIPASGTNSEIHTSSELHLIADNGAGSSNSVTTKYDTPIFYKSVTVAEGYVTYTFDALPCNTDFYLRVINEAFTPT